MVQWHLLYTYPSADRKTRNHEEVMKEDEETNKQKERKNAIGRTMREPDVEEQ